MPWEDRTKQAFEMIEQGVKDVYTSENFLNYLTMLSKFHDYSFNNVMLILSQYPAASLVAGYNSWQSLYNYCFEDIGYQGLKRPFITNSLEFINYCEMEKMAKPILEGKARYIKAGNITATQAIKELNICRSTFYKRVKEKENK